MEIGSHTVNHVRLPEAEDATLMCELSASKATLEDLLGKPVESFAYPYGAWNEHCEAAVQKAGYHYACTTRTGLALRDDNSYRLRRLTVFNDDTTGSFARKLALIANDASWNSVLRYAVGRAVARLPIRVGRRTGKITHESE